MNRRDFLTRTLAFLPLPAFARAASLWLPKERPFFVPETEITYTHRPFTPEERAMVDELMRKVWGPAIEAHIFEHARLLGLDMKRPSIWTFEDGPCRDARIE